MYWIRRAATHTSYASGICDNCVVRAAVPQLFKSRLTSVTHRSTLSGTARRTRRSQRPAAARPASTARRNALTEMGRRSCAREHGLMVARAHQLRENSRPINTSHGVVRVRRSLAGDAFTATRREQLSSGPCGESPANRARRRPPRSVLGLKVCCVCYKSLSLSHLCISLSFTIMRIKVMCVCFAGCP